MFAQIKRERRQPIPIPVPRSRPGTVRDYTPAIVHGDFEAPTATDGPRREARIIGSRPQECPARRWCGCFLAKLLGMARRDLWLARNWAHVGSPTSGPHVGAIVVWPHHVGIITGKTSAGWVIKSGNDGHRVRERVRSVSRAIAYRLPS